jgi:hypothetical protein
MYSKHAADHDQGFVLSEDGRTLRHATSDRKASYIPSSANRREQVEEAPGYHGEPVMTTRSMAIFRREFERLIAQIPEGIRVINATEGGTHIAGTEQMPFAEALDAFFTAPVDVEGVLAECARVSDYDERAGRTIDELAVVGETLDLAKRIAQRCDGLAAELAAEQRADEPALVRLQAEEARLLKALKTLNPIFENALARGIQPVLARGSEVRSLQDSYLHSAVVYRAVIKAVEKLLPKVDAAIEALAADADPQS